MKATAWPRFSCIMWTRTAPMPTRNMTGGPRLARPSQGGKTPPLHGIPHMNSNLVTVFGGSGFLGRHTVRALARAGWRIKIATRHPAKGFFLRPLGTVGQIDFVKCDISDADEVAQALMGSDAVINL